MADLITEIGAILVTGLFGNIYIATVFLFGLMAAFGLAMHFTLDCWIVTMTPLIWVLAFHPETHLLPPWLWTVFALGLGVIIFLAVIRIVRNR